MKIGLLEKALGIVGVAAILVGISFAKGAMEENEPQAARTGLRILGTLGLGLILLAGLIALIRNCNAAGNRCEP